jgi:hypothetical protein
MSNGSGYVWRAMKEDKNFIIADGKHPLFIEIWLLQNGSALSHVAFRDYLKNVKAIQRSSTSPV